MSSEKKRATGNRTPARSKSKSKSRTTPKKPVHIGQGVYVSKKDLYRTLGFKLPPPNLQGDYHGSCVVCLQGTDTGIAFVGPAEWAVAGLMTLGIPEDQAFDTISFGTGCDRGMIPEGEQTIPVRVCQSCVDKCGVRFPLGLIATGIPAISPRSDSEAS